MSPAEKARLWYTRKKITGKDSNQSPPPSIINQVKRKISELKVIIRDLERSMDSNEGNNLSIEGDDKIEVNARNSTLTRQPPSGKRLNNIGV